MKKWTPLLIIIIFFGFLGGAISYLSIRTAFFFSIEKTSSLYLLFISTTIIVFTGLFVFSNSTKLPGRLIHMTSGVLIGLLLYYLIALGLVDLFNLIFNLQEYLPGLIALSLAILISSFGVFNAFNIKTSTFEIELKGLEEEISAVHLSDIHIGHYRGSKFLNNVVSKTNALNPQLIFITGDLFDGRINLKPEVLESLKELRAPVFFVEGNHDHYSGIDEVKKYLRDINVHVLENEIYIWNGIQIIGLNHMQADHETTGMHAIKGGTIKETLEQLDISSTTPAILLHHSPDGVQYADKHKIDLYLSGHTHAGQMFPINLITKLIFPYNKGLNHFNGSSILVSQGIGTFGPPMRVGTKSEIIQLKLNNKQS